MSLVATLIRLAAVAIAPLVCTVLAEGKPLAPPKEEKKTSPAPAAASAPGEIGSSSFLRWLLLQNGGPDAVAVGWPETVRVTTGKQITPLDPAKPADAAIVTKLGTALDLTLPRLNKPDGPLRSAALLTSAEIAARVTEELRAALTTDRAVTVVSLSEVPMTELVYPALRCTDAAGKTYYLSVVLYPTGARETALRALTYQPAAGVKRIAADGCCLLVAIEHNGRPGSAQAFLNWELIDLARVSLRCAVGFEADENALHQPGATVTDGRKGRD